MQIMRRPRGLGFLLAFISVAEGFIWPISNTYSVGQSKFTFSELYMYSKDDAPMGMTFVDRPEIRTHLDVTLKPEYASKYNRVQNVSVAIAVFHVPSETIPDNMDMEGANELLQLIAGQTELCKVGHGGRSLDPQIPASAQLLFRVFHAAENPETGIYHATAHMRYVVAQSGIQSVIMEVCELKNGGSTPAGDMSVSIEGDITFRNPYGYLSGIYFGYIPFEGARAFLFGMFGILYVFALVIYKDQIIPSLHYGIVVVILIATTEALAWFGAYVAMNDQGTPYCCPFPTGVIVAMVLEMLRRTLSRALLLVLCMGFGVVHQHLKLKQVLLILSLSIAYLASSVIVDAHDIVEINNLNRTQAHSLWWDVPVLVFDLAFLIWIYLSLINTMNSLKDRGESHKFKMYSQLAYTMGVFVIFVSLLTMVIVLARSGAFTWPWQLYWMQTVAWEILNLAVIVAVSLIWAPDANFQAKAQSMQLQTFEEDPDPEWSGDEDRDVEMTGMDDDGEEEVDDEGQGDDFVGRQGEYTGIAAAEDDDE